MQMESLFVFALSGAAFAYPLQISRRDGPTVTSAVRNIHSAILNTDYEILRLSSSGGVGGVISVLGALQQTMEKEGQRMAKSTRMWLTDEFFQSMIPMASVRQSAELAIAHLVKKKDIIKSVGGLVKVSKALKQLGAEFTSLTESYINQIPPFAEDYRDKYIPNVARLVNNVVDATIMVLGF
jgi:hypothetical protein